MFYVVDVNNKEVYDVKFGLDLFIIVSWFILLVFVFWLLICIILVFIEWELVWI